MICGCALSAQNRMLEQYGRGDFVENMPVLFALYYCTAITVMQIPEEPTGMELQKLYLKTSAIWKMSA